MVNTLSGSVCAYRKETVKPRFIRIDEVMALLDVTQDEAMPSYKTKQVDEQGKPIYQDVCYPVTKDFREKLYNEIISEYEKAKDKSNEKARESAEKHHGNPDKEKDKEATPFR